MAFVFRDVATSTLDHSEFGYEMGWTARSLFLGRGFGSPFQPLSGPTALVPPLYPFLLAGIFKLFGLYTIKAAIATLSINSLFSALTCIPIYFSTRHALSTRLARFAAFGWAIYPFAINFSADRVWDYALTALLFSCCIWAAQRLHLRSLWSWLGTGVLFGLTALSNPSIATILPFLFLIALLKVKRVDGPWLRNGLVTVLACAALCAPWAIRNHRVVHTNSMFRDGFWLELWAGNNGDTFTSNPDWCHPASNAVEMQKYLQQGELPYMAEKRALAIDFMSHHPLFTAKVTARRAIRFWTGFWSFSSRYLRNEPFDIPNFFFCTTLTLFLLRGIVLWWQEDRGSALPYIIGVILFPIPYYLTHSSMDYRQPLEPVIIVLIVAGIFGVEDSNDRTMGEFDEASEDKESFLTAAI